MHASHVPAERTASVVSDARLRSSGDWILIVAMDCQALAATPESFGLGGVNQISIGRGPRRAFERTGSRARLDLPDRWVSFNHARLVRTQDGWCIEDEGSRNGSRVNGEPTARRVLSEADVIECGGTFLVLRRGGPAVPSPEPLFERPEALRTLSPGFDRELQVVRKVAHSPVPLLVLGESGTGKEGMINVVHSLSGRKGPLVAVNCGAIPATLIESVLFGSRRGAFSGAQDRPGLVRSAEGGTLFLDEVAELPISSQAALLRVLQEREFLPLGGTRSIPVDIRVVAATNRPVHEFLDAGLLRPDLYARLRGYAIRLPPLHERCEDLGHLVSTLIARHGKGGRPRTLSPPAASALFAYSWPLNIRELEQCLSTALAVAGPEISLEHLPRPIRDHSAAPARLPTPPSKREELIASIQKHGGNLSAVARELATSISQLHRLLSRYAIDPDELRHPT